MKKRLVKHELERLESLFKLAENNVYNRKIGKIDLNLCAENMLCFADLEPTLQELQAKRSIDGFSLLHIAVGKLNPYLVAFLLLLGVSADIKAKEDGVTAREIFEKTGYLVSGMNEAFYFPERFLLKANLLKYKPIEEEREKANNKDFVDNFKKELTKALYSSDISKKTSSNDEVPEMSISGDFDKCDIN
jgi:hypothetical protein